MSLKDLPIELLLEIFTFTNPSLVVDDPEIITTTSTTTTAATVTTTNDNNILLQKEEEENNHLNDDFNQQQEEEEEEHENKKRKKKEEEKLTIQKKRIQTLKAFKFYLITLPSISKTFYEILRNSLSGNYFYKKIYNSYFSYRNNLQNNNLENKENLEINFYFNLLKSEILFFKNWKLKFPFEERQSYILNNLTAIKKSVGSEMIIVDQPLFYKSGIYYFETNCKKHRGTGDNVFVGFLIKKINQSKTQYDYSTHTYLGDNNYSLGYYFANGDIYYGGGSVYSKFGDSVPVDSILGVYIDMNKLEFTFIRNNKFITPIQNMKQKYFTEKSFPELRMKNDSSNDSNDDLVALYPAISLLYDDDEIELDSFAGCSFEKCRWIKKELKRVKQEEKEKNLMIGNDDDEMNEQQEQLLDDNSSESDLEINGSDLFG
ncbi:hypothetical protein ABK040_013571 [Willaertia magna]